MISYAPVPCTRTNTQREPVVAVPGRYDLAPEPLASLSGWPENRSLARRAGTGCTQPAAAGLAATSITIATTHLFLSQEAGPVGV